MLSIFLCAFWPSVCLLWKNVCLDLPIFWFLLCQMSCLEINPLSVAVCTYLFPFCGLSFHFVYGFLCCAKAVNIYISFIYFYFYLHYSRRWIKTDVAAIYVRDYSASVFLEVFFIVSSLTFRSLVHFEFIFVYGVIQNGVLYFHFFLHVTI